jgi:hypothetical protein
MAMSTSETSLMHLHTHMDNNKKTRKERHTDLIKSNQAVINNYFNLKCLIPMSSVTYMSKNVRLLNRI